MVKEMKKLFVGFGIFILMIFFVIAVSDVDERVERALEKEGINASESIIKEVNLTEPPEGIILEDLEDTNIAIYSVDYGTGRPIFVITPSGNVKAEVPVQKSRQILNFGFGGSSNESKFLKTITGVESGANKGYVMLGEGSVVGISTNLEIIEGNGEIEIIIYKNGEAVGFGNFFIASSGVKNDYDIQSGGIATFEAGDVISVYLNSDEETEWKDVTTMIEIERIN